MRPLILDLEHSIFDLSGGESRPGGRELLQALVSARVPLSFLTVADPVSRTEKEESLATFLRGEGLGEAASRLAGRFVAVAASGDESVARRWYEEGIRAAVASCGEKGDHAHTAVLLSRDPLHLDVARSVGLLAYPLGEMARETAAIGDLDSAADLVETLRWHPCDKRRTAAKGRLASTAATR